MAQRVGAGRRGGYDTIMGTVSHAVLAVMPCLQLLALGNFVWVPVETLGRLQRS